MDKERDCGKGGMKKEIEERKEEREGDRVQEGKTRKKKTGTGRRDGGEGWTKKI